MAINVETLAAAMGYTNNSIAGGGAIKGKNCVITDISPITGGNRVTFQWTLDNGTVQSDTMDVMDGATGPEGEDGLGIKSVDINANNHLIVTYDDDTTQDAGEIEGGGSGGISIVSYGISTFAEVLAAYQNNSLVFCRASSETNPATGAQKRIAPLVYVEPSGASIGSFEFQYYRSVSTHTESQQGDQIFVYKVHVNNGWTVTVRAASSKVVASNGLSSSYANDTLTLTADIDEYVEVSGGGANLYDSTAGHANFKPGTTRGVSKYTDGETTSAYTTNLVPCVRGDKFKFSCEGAPFSYMRVFMYDDDDYYVTATGNIYTDTDGNQYFEIQDSAAKKFCLVLGWNGSASAYSTLYLTKYDDFGSEKVIIDELYFNDNNVAMAKDRLGLVDDILYGKKWAVGGDSFTAGDFTGITTPTIPSGKYAGQKAVYPYLIGTRCNMTIQDLSLGGRTLALPSGEGSSYNSFVNQYQSVAADADYLTMYFGINDSHQSIPIGTISDNTTDSFYGAWNVILSWLIENRPNLHVGIIVSNGCDSDDYRTATIAIAQKYGIPYIDMNGDKQTPCMIRSTNASIDASVRNQRTANWRVSESNGHPNADCHAFEATFIEDFLRTL